LLLLFSDYFPFLFQRTRFGAVKKLYKKESKLY
jgi:hypothetical protein